MAILTGNLRKHSSRDDFWQRTQKERKEAQNCFKKLGPNRNNIRSFGGRLGPRSPRARPPYYLD